MKEYNEEDFLLLSGIQHFTFCRRQWALIHIEQQWAENFLTVDGDILHERAHDDSLRETRGNIVISRGMPIVSRTLGATGVCDIVELHKSKNGVPIQGLEGNFIPIPIEYKRGKPKTGEEDVLQLAAQAICLSEMLLCDVPKGYLYYGETGRRTPVEINDTLKEHVYKIFSEMHELYQKRHTPVCKPTKACRSCSLQDLCLPKIAKKQSVSAYLAKRLHEIKSEDSDE